MRRSRDFVTAQCGDLGAPLRSPAYITPAFMLCACIGV